RSHARPCPDLDHGACRQGRGHHPQDGARARRRSVAPELGGAFPGTQEHVVLRDEGLGVGPAGGPSVAGVDVAGDDSSTGGTGGPVERWAQGDRTRERVEVPGRCRGTMGVMTRPITGSPAAPQGVDGGPAPAPDAAWTPPTWDAIVREHSARVYRLAYRLSGNQQDAEDLTQETFLRVF